MEELRAPIIAKISAATSLPASEIHLERPKTAEHGDFAFPCFALSKTQRKSPNLIAQELALAISPGDSIERVESVGGYVNFTLDAAHVTSHLARSLNEKTLGKPRMRREKVMIEFCQANTHKPFHIGHFRNICLGDSLVRLWRQSGHEVISANYQGDVGAHVAKCLWGLRAFHANEKPPAQHRGEWLGAIYAEANSLSDESDESKNAISETLQQLEAGEPELTRIWQETRQWCLDEYDAYYKLMGISFDELFFESEVEKPGKELVKELLAKGIAKMDNGAAIVDLEQYKLGVFVILKSDGTSLYATKDLALAARKFDEFKIERSVYVVGSEQKFYFQQLFKTLQLMGFAHADKCFHLSYELVMLPEGKMSSREGNVVTFRSVYEDVFAHALSEVAKRHSDWELARTKTVAHDIALAAMKFAMLDQDNNKTIIFNKEKALDFEGESGPYIQYVIARINSIFRKHDGNVPAIPGAYEHAAETRLVKLLARFTEAVHKATIEYKPLLLAKYLVELAQAFNDFYNACPILKESDSVRDSRLWLANAVKDVLSQGLLLLGINAVEEM